MAKGRGGYGGFTGGMPGNMNNLLKQAQKMQKQMEEAQTALEEEVVTATAGGGAIEVTMTGKKVLTSVKIDKDAVDPEDVEMLEDMVMAAVNEALKKVDELSEEKMAKFTRGVGGFNGLF
ncbi:MAG: YbaB/EbfC family nucleoid-associated protein [Lachnospiraceae bacterium]|nr:YbaB/EbfC family nucleoid-associated protein [Lachnospiraceae bacterium]